jgi:alpha-1,6-mannosyltransferase
MRPLTFCDVATFYCPTGGGLRTYYNAKVEWFRRQTTHRYVLIVPAGRSATREMTASVTVIEARGIRVNHASDSYRFFSDFAYIRSAIREHRPDVLETGDPWVSGPFALWLRRRDRMPSIVSSFFHADPMRTYIEPAFARCTPPWMAMTLSSIAGRAFYQLQESYDLTIVSSPCSFDRLTQAGVNKLRRVPFGADAVFFQTGEHRQSAEPPRRRLLYAGRLDRDKQIDLLITILPRLLDDPDVFVTVAGTGALRSTFEHWIHPRFRYVGYVRDREPLAALYGEHDIFLAPGAYETFGLAALEAAAAGLVIVGPDHGGTGAILREMHSPFVFTAGESDDFLAAVRAALETDWTPASQASRRVAARYGTWPDAVARLVDTYKQILQKDLCADAPSSCRCTT